MSGSLLASRTALLAQIRRFAGQGRLSILCEAAVSHSETLYGGCAPVEQPVSTIELITISRPLDLFGLPLVEPRGKGRPRHVPTDASRCTVVELQAEGLNQVEIANAIGITAPTLLRHYHLELGSTSQAWRGLKGATDDGN